MGRGPAWEKEEDQLLLALIRHNQTLPQPRENIFTLAEMLLDRSPKACYRRYERIKEGPMEDSIEDEETEQLRKGIERLVEPILSENRELKAELERVKGVKWNELRELLEPRQLNF